MTSTTVFVGIDVAKAHLDVAALRWNPVIRAF